MISPDDFLKWLLVFGVGVDQPIGTFATQQQVQQGVFNKAMDTGAVNAYTLALSPAIASYTDGFLVRFTPLHTSTINNPTLAINGLTARTITLSSGAVLSIGALAAGVPAFLMYNLASTTFMLLNPATTSTTFTWNGVPGTSQAANINSGYVIQNASQTTITTPAIAPLGSIVSIRGLGAAGWIMAANTGQIIYVDGQATTSGGSLTSAGQYDSIDITCVVANTTWIASSVISSGLTYA